MSARKKVLGVQLDGLRIECIKINDPKERNPFRVYRVTTSHRRQIAKYGDFISVISFLYMMYRDGADTFPIHDLVQWAKDRGCI